MPKQLGSKIQNLLDYSVLALVLALLFLVPFVFDFSLNLGYELPKLLLFKIITSSLLFIKLLENFWASLVSRKSPDKAIDSRQQMVGVLFVALMGLLIVHSWFFSGNFLQSIFGNYDKRMGLVFVGNLLALVWVLVGIRKELFKKLLDLVGIFAVAVAYFLALQAGIQYFFDSQTMEMAEGRVVGLFGQANFLSGYVLVLLSVLWFGKENDGMVGRFGSWKNFFLKIFPACLLVGILLLAKSRINQVLAVALLGFAIWDFAKAKYSSQNSKFPKIGNINNLKSIGLGLFVVVFGILGMVIANPRFVENGIIDKSRREIWAASIAAIKQKPWLGYGIETQGFVLPPQMYSSGVDTQIALDRAHNLVLDLVLQTGFVGAVVVFGLGVWVFGRHIYVWYKRGGQKPKPISTPFILIIALFFVRGMFNTISTTDFIWLAFSFGVLMRSISFIPFWFPKQKQVVFPLIIVFVILSGLNFNRAVQEYRADRMYSLFNFTGEQVYISRAVRQNPYELRYKVEFLRSSADYAPAEDLLEIIKEIDEKNSLVYPHIYQIGYVLSPVGASEKEIFRLKYNQNSPNSSKINE